MWSLGTILAELLDHTPLFTGASDLDQLAKIAKFLGAPTSLPREAQWFSIKTPQELQVDWNNYFAHRIRQNEELGSHAVDLI